MTTTIEHNYWLITADVEFENTGKSGIGSYEFWGSKGFDEGEDEFEVEDIQVIEVINPDGDFVPVSDISKETMAIWKELIAEQALEEYQPDEH